MWSKSQLLFHCVQVFYADGQGLLRVGLDPCRLVFLEYDLVHLVHVHRELFVTLDKIGFCFQHPERKFCVEFTLRANQANAWMSCLTYSTSDVLISLFLLDAKPYHLRSSNRARR